MLRERERCGIALGLIAGILGGLALGASGYGALGMLAFAVCVAVGGGLGMRADRWVR